MTPQMRTIISRGAMLVLGLVLLYAGYKCISVGLIALEEAKKLQPVSTIGIVPRRRMSGAGLPMLLGIVLALLGALTAVASMMPIWLMEKLRPAPPTTGQSRVD